MKKSLRPYELLTLALLLSACSITYELLMANTLAIMTGSYIWWQSITIGVYIGGLGVGSSLAGKSQDPLKELFWVEIILSSLGGLSVFLLYLLHGGYHSSDFLFYIQNDYSSPVYQQYNLLLKSVFIFFVQALTFFIGLLSGFEIPLVMRIFKQEKAEEMDHKVLGFNYIGTLFGSVCFAFFLIPKVNVLAISIIVGLVNIFVCYYLFARGVIKISPKKSLALFFTSFLLFFLGSNINKVEQYYLKTFYLFKSFATLPGTRPIHFFQKIDQFNPVERLKSKYQFIDIYQPDPFDKSEKVMAIDMNFQFSSQNEQYYHEAFVHIPLSMIQVNPKRVLVLGGGDGLLIREILKHSEIENIVHVELDEFVLDVAKNRKFFKELNRSSLEDPRVESIVGDAFYFLRNNKKKFDAIFIDFPYPNSYNLARLYSIEFYRFVFQSLEANGFVVLDAPIHDKRSEIPTHEYGQVVVDNVFREEDEQSNSILLSTAYFAGFPQLFPYKVNHESFLLMTKEGVALHYDIDQKNLSYYERITQVDLREVMRLKYPYKIDPSLINSLFRPKLLRNSNF